MLKRFGLAGLGMMLCMIAPNEAGAQQGEPMHPGQAIYRQNCATCHDNPGTTRAATLAALQSTPAERLREALTVGVMRPMAANLSPTDISQLVGWLSRGQAVASQTWATSMMCASNKRAVVLPANPFGFFGADAEGTRALKAERSGLRKEDLKNLEVAWAIGLPQTNSTGVGVIVEGDTAFLNGGGKLLALDTSSGCAKWIYDGGQSRTTPTLASIKGVPSLVYSTTNGKVHAVDARNGKALWVADGRPSNGAGAIRGAIAVHGDKLIVPISDSGVSAAANKNHECCAGHGAVVALNASDGARLWEYHTMEEAKYTGLVNSAGVKLKGPSGAPIWSTPVIDAARNRVIVTTGENTSHPATDTSDAIIALDMDTGRVAWNFQAWEADVWNLACDTLSQTRGPNCPDNFGGYGRDFDFGGSAIVLRSDNSSGSNDIILAGQKSGDVWALDAEDGTLLWNRRIGDGTALGGNHWGVATDGQRVYVPINDPDFRQFAWYTPRPGMYAFDARTGKSVWSYQQKPDCEGEVGKHVNNCAVRYGLSATPLVIDDAVVAGTLAGKVLVFDAETGAKLNEIETAGPVKTTNGVEGRGGSIDAHGVSAGGGMLFIGSGYASFNQTPGNVLIALKPKRPEN